MNRIVLIAALCAATLPGIGESLLAQQAGPAKFPNQSGRGPLKVFILAGQSNMEGQAVADLDGEDYNGGKGTLVQLLRDPPRASRFKHLQEATGKWTVRDDVWVRYQREQGPLLCGPLTVGFSVYGDKHHFGPELQFGHVIGDHFNNQVLLIKTAWGGKSLYRDFRPPSSGGQLGPYYTKMLVEIREALANLKFEFPGYDGGGYELAGFVWYQGWNDGCEPKTAVPEYEWNLVNLIKDVRKDLNAPHLPFVIGELTGPWVEAPGEWAALRKAQAAAVARPEFQNNARFVETHDFVRNPEDSPNPGHGHHEFGNAETALLVGDALGRGMLRLCTREIRWWVSSADLKLQLAEQPALEWRDESTTVGTRIEVTPAVTFQTMLGLGSSLEPATCSNLWRMSDADRERTLERLVSPTIGIGMNLMRLCIGTPDFTGDAWYSYNDLPRGETDPELKRFSIAKDRAYILPVLKLARQKNPELLFFASPWSPPGWMKSTGTMIGGQLLPQWYPAYAEYFVKFIRAYEAEGIPIYAVTIQNEPGVDRAKEKNAKWHYPSCRWTGEQERDFIRDHLGPAFRRHGLKTLIWCYDHNYNARPSGDDPGIAYPRTILSDAVAAQFVSGVAFHGYVGAPSGMSVFHGEFPKVPLYFTEGSVFGIKGGVELIEKLRHHASAYNAWVTLLDDNGKPNNGPFEASRTIITLDPKTRKPKEHFDYFLYGQFMKFVRRGAHRVESAAADNSLANVAFRNPDGSVVLIVVNTGGSVESLSLNCGGRGAAARLPGKSVATFNWD